MNRRDFLKSSGASLTALALAGFPTLVYQNLQRTVSLPTGARPADRYSFVNTGAGYLHIQGAGRYVPPIPPGEGRTITV